MSNLFEYSTKYKDVNYQLYDDYDLTTQKIVKAEYKKSKIPYDRGNFYIECLPEPKTSPEEVFSSYNKELLPFSEEEKKNLKIYEKMSAVSLLRQMRVPLPFHATLEAEFYLSILNSYRNRKPTVFSNVMVNNEDINDQTSVLLRGRDAAATNSGFALLGYSGCGKSSALEILLSSYPQVIIHLFDDYQVTQIVYLTVNCIANSNFSALYVAIGTAIDNALGFDKPIYEKVIQKQKSLGEKSDVIRSLIEKFGIGIIIFDEIQLIDFSSTRENSIEGLLNLANRTKVAMGVVGTEDAFKNMFPKLRTGRRFGETIIGHEYCSNYKYFEFLVGKVFSYQWFGEQLVKPDDDLVKALYDCTRGIIDQLIGIYIFMQLDYIIAKRKPKITSKYVYKVTEKHYPGLVSLLKDLENPFEEKSRIEIIAKGNQEIENMIKKAKNKQVKEANKLIEYNVHEEKTDTKMMLTSIVNSIMDVSDDFDFESILSVATKCIQKYPEDDIKSLKKKTFKMLETNKLKVEKSKSKKSQSSVDSFHMGLLNGLLDKKEGV